MDEVPADVFAEWCAFMALEPSGYELGNLVAGRIAWAAIAPHTKLKVKEDQLRLNLGGRSGDSPELERARMQAMAIRHNLAAKHG